MNDTINDNQADKQQRNSTEEKIKMGGKESNFHPWIYKHQWKKGESGNPKGRPPGKSMKEFARDLLASKTEEERIEFLDGMPKDILWRMAEGQPHQTSEMDLKAKISVEFASEFNKSNEIKSPSKAKPDNTLKPQIQSDSGGKESGQNKV